MRIVIAMLLSLTTVLAQGPNTVGLKNPASLMMMNPVLYPTQVSGLVMWLSADYGVYNDAGVTLCTDGQTVQQWKDQSGNGNDVGRDTAAQRPTYFVNRINGLPAVCFGTGTFNLLTNDFASSFPHPSTVLCVFYPSNTAATALYSGNGLGGPQGTWVTTWNIRVSGALTLSATGVRQTGVWYVSSGIHNYTNSRVFIYSKLRNQGPLETNINTGIILGGTGGGGSLFKGQLAEFILYSRLLTDTQRYGVEMYLKRKYALADPF